MASFRRFIGALFAGRTRITRHTNQFRGKWNASGNRRVHAANRKGAVTEANRATYFPRAASELVYVDLQVAGTDPENIDLDKSPIEELNERWYYLSESKRVPADISRNSSDMLVAHFASSIL